MPGSETIQRENTLALWKALKQDNAALRLRSAGESGSWQAVVVDVRTRKRKLYLIVKPSEQLCAALTGSTEARLLLEFTDRNKVPYSCEIDDFKLTESDIWLAIPETIERHQRRKIFRLEAPSGSELSLNIKGVDCTLLLIDVSINGALGLMSHLNPRGERSILGQQGQTIPDAVLIFPSCTGTRRILISECTIRRLEPHATTGKMQYALEFTAIDENNEQLLTKLIYEYQREYLRRRRKTR